MPLCPLPLYLSTKKSKSQNLVLILKKSRTQSQNLFSGSCHNYRTRSCLGHTPSTAGTFQKKFLKNSGKTPETCSQSVSWNSPQIPERPRKRVLRAFPGIPLRSTAGCPKPYNSRHLRLPEHFQNSAGHGIPTGTEGISDSRLSRDRIHLRPSNPPNMAVVSNSGSSPGETQEKVPQPLF